MRQIKLTCVGVLLQVVTDKLKNGAYIVMLVDNALVLCQETIANRKAALAAHDKLVEETLAFEARNPPRHD